MSTAPLTGELFVDSECPCRALLRRKRLRPLNTAFRQVHETGPRVRGGSNLHERRGHLSEDTRKDSEESLDVLPGLLRPDIEDAITYAGNIRGPVCPRNGQRDDGRFVRQPNRLNQ